MVCRVRPPPPCLSLGGVGATRERTVRGRVRAAMEGGNILTGDPPLSDEEGLSVLVCVVQYVNKHHMFIFRINNMFIFSLNIVFFQGLFFQAGLFSLQCL